MTRRVVDALQVDDQIEGEGLLSIRDHFLRVKVFTEKGAQEWTQHEADYPRKGVSISDEPPCFPVRIMTPGSRHATILPIANFRSIAFM